MFLAHASPGVEKEINSTSSAAPESMFTGAMQPAESLRPKQAYLFCALNSSEWPMSGSGAASYAAVCTIACTNPLEQQHTQILIAYGTMRDPAAASWFAPPLGVLGGLWGCHGIKLRGRHSNWIRKMHHLQPRSYCIVPGTSVFVPSLPVFVKIQHAKHDGGPQQALQIATSVEV